MVWTETKDLTLLREMAAEGLMHHKPKSRDRGAAWQKVVDHLNPLPDFDVATRSIRDRFNNLAKKHKVRMAKEERGTGGGGEELSELESLLEELTEIGEETDQRLEEEAATRRNEMDEDRRKALEMRKRAMETMGETRERLGKGDNGEKKRRSAGQSMDWLEKAIKAKEEMANEERRQREDDRKQQHEVQVQFVEEFQINQQQQAAQAVATEQRWLQFMQQQQQQQHQQQQQFTMVQNAMLQMMEQQQRQTEMTLELFKKSKN